MKTLHAPPLSSPSEVESKSRGWRLKILEKICWRRCEKINFGGGMCYVGGE